MQLRPAHVAEERDRLIGFLRENLPAHARDDYYDWLYLKNPDGLARAWVLEEPDSGRLIGSAAAFPRRMRVRDGEVVAWNLGDFAVDRGHRSLGPALRLQRACLQPVRDGEVAFCYDHPSCTMAAIYRRIGDAAEGRVIRFAKPLRVDRKIEQVLGEGGVARGVSSVGNLVLSLSDRASRVGDSRTPVSLLRGRFDERFTELDRALAGHDEVAGVRSADYLNWRYLDSPLHRYTVLLAEEGEQLLGYAVFRLGEGEAVLRELRATSAGEAAPALLAAVAAAGRQAGSATVSAPILEGSPLTPVLEQSGYRAREDAPFVVCTCPGGAWDGIVTDTGSWFHSDGDRDG